MDSSKKKIILFCVISIIFVLITVFIVFDFFNMKNDVDMFFVNENKESVVDDNDVVDNKFEDKKKDEIISDKSDDSSFVNDSTMSDMSDNSNDVVDDKNNIVENVKDDNLNLFSENDVVNYFENMSNEVEKSSSFKEKFKEYFTTIVDFIFYNKQINGYTFDELTGTAKTKIISIALKIDTKIEEYVPNYKENLSSTSNKIYTDIKNKLVVLYMDISTDICKNNEEDCDKVKEIFVEIKDGCKIGWDFIKGLVKGGVSKVKDWYEIYSGK